MEYTEKVLEHFRAPHNVGVIEDADGTGQVGDASCGDVFLMTIMVRDERLVDIDDDIAEELDGLPLEKLHCSNLAATVLHRAIADYRRRQKGDLRNGRALYRR